MIESRWKTFFSPAADKEFRKLDFVEKKRIAKFIEEKILKAVDPRVLGKKLPGPLDGFLRFRFGNYRIIVDFIPHDWTIRILKRGHRRSLYILKS